MQHTYRATRRLQPQKDETLIGSTEQAEKILADLDSKLQKKVSSQERATYLCAKATLFEALGDRRMLEAAQEAFKYTKTAQSAALVAVALHHFGRIKESLEWYERAYRYPHEAGFEIDIGYSNALLFTPEKWHKAWPIIKQLKKRMVYALYLPFWNGKPCKEISVISEGGFGDLIQNCRYLPLISAMGIKPTVYLPPYFFETGMVELLRLQPWFPEIKPMVETPRDIPAAGFFDLPAIFNATESTIPSYPQPLIPKSDRSVLFGDHLSTIHRIGKKIAGICWAARAMETPLCPDGVYRSLTIKQAEKLVFEGSEKVGWVSLQKDSSSTLLPLIPTVLNNWTETAAIISALDLVVTVDTGVAHLAAAMGKPTWVILSGAVDWKFGLSGDKCPWYPTMRLFRNDDFGFDKAVEKTITALKEL